MKICFVCSEYPPSPCGGMGIVVATLAPALVARGHQVRVIGLYPSYEAAPARELRDGVPVWRLTQPDVCGGWIWGRMRLFRAIRAWARAGEIDVVEVPKSRGWAAGWGRLPVPVVCRIHGSKFLEAKALGMRPNRFYTWIETQSLRRADACAAVSDYIARSTACYFPVDFDRIRRIYNPVDLGAYADVVSGEERIPGSVVFAGTMNENKGVCHLVRAWPRVRARFPAASLHLYGRDGRLRDGRSMSAWVAESAGSPDVSGIHVHGHIPRPDLLVEFSRAAAAVFPSNVEAFGLAAAEAMGCGCPTVFTERSTGPELIVHEQEGLLVNPESSDGIADAILKILSDRDAALRFSRNGRRRVQEKFSLAPILAENERWYEECIAQFSATSPRGSG
jgi:glycosyltransferase involved in cell wall biosynthesis